MSSSAVSMFYTEILIWLLIGREYLYIIRVLKGTVLCFTYVLDNFFVCEMKFLHFRYGGGWWDF